MLKKKKTVGSGWRYCTNHARLVLPPTKRTLRSVLSAIGSDRWSGVGRLLVFQHACPTYTEAECWPYTPLFFKLPNVSRASARVNGALETDVMGCYHTVYNSCVLAVVWDLQIGVSAVQPFTGSLVFLSMNTRLTMIGWEVEIVASSSRLSADADLSFVDPAEDDVL